MAKWVQHVSRMGDKYRVEELFDNTVWRACRPVGLCDYVFPKSEYVECEEPEEWENVTYQYETNGRVIGPPGHQSFQVIKTSDRIRKVIVNAGLEAEGWAFIIERRKA